MKYTKEEKTKIKEARFEARYGEAYLRSAIKECGDLALAAKIYYDMYKQSRRHAAIEARIATMFYSLSLAMVILGIWAPGFLISGAMFLILAVHSSVDSRLEVLWSSKFSDNICNLQRYVELSNALSSKNKRSKK